MPSISPDQVKKLRKRAGLTQAEAARTVHVSLRTWQSWETPNQSEHARTMPEANVELFCIKQQIPYPPRS
jgi:DNA-binding transcriptional regulator YiaG